MTFRLRWLAALAFITSVAIVVIGSLGPTAEYNYDFAGLAPRTVVVDPGYTAADQPVRDGATDGAAGRREYDDRAQVARASASVVGYGSAPQTTRNFGNYGSEFLDDGARMVDQPLRPSGYGYATSTQKLDHIFVPKHNLDPLVAGFGSREAVVEQMLLGIRGRTPASGVFDIPTTIGGQTVVVRGAVVDGVPRLGTAFTP